MMSKNKDIVIILYAMPILMSIVFFDRAIYNNVIVQLTTFFRDDNDKVYDVFEDLIDVHLTFYTVSDFLSGLIQLYLTYKLGVKIQAQDKKDDYDNLETSKGFFPVNRSISSASVRLTSDAITKTASIT